MLTPASPASSPLSRSRYLSSAIEHTPHIHLSPLPTDPSEDSDPAVGSDEQLSSYLSRPDSQAMVSIVAIRSSVISTASHIIVR